MNSKNIYDEAFVGNLFDRMARTYGIVNYLASFGFSERWRRQCVDEIRWSGDTRVVFDLMSGMGECWGLILSRGRRVECITGVDISAEMNRRATVNLEKHSAWPVAIRQENILQNSIPSDSADVLVSAFGLKTFSEQQLERLAAEMNRILKPGGQVAVIEISTPKPWLLRVPYLFYLKWVIPVIGALFMSNPDTYGMLGRYCSNFGTCLSFHEKLRKAGLEVTYREYFFGCATGGWDENLLERQYETRGVLQLILCKSKIQFWICIKTRCLGIDSLPHRLPHRRQSAGFPVPSWPQIVQPTTNSGL